MDDLKSRFKVDADGKLVTRLQLTTDGMTGYPAAIAKHFGKGVDYAVLNKNLSMRMGIRRFTRLTNSFSKKIENHMHAVSFYFMAHNFVKVHGLIMTTPAIKADVASFKWTMEDILLMAETSN